MKKIIDSYGDEFFSCPHREWRVTLKDEYVTEQPEDTVKDHDCEVITVYRQNMGIKRFFFKKVIHI